LLDYQNNYVRNSSVMSNAAKNFDILATSLNVLHNYFNKIFKSVSNYIFKYFSTTILSV